MERIIERCAGLNVHKSSVIACVRITDEDGALRQEIREFATTTRGLLLLRDWLASFEVSLVGMEATGVYWKPIYYVPLRTTSSCGSSMPGTSRTYPAGRPT